MIDLPFPLSTPDLRDDLPRYPPLIQLVRVTGGTVPGPSGYTSSSIQAASLYVASTQQLRTDTLFPRDREPCLALDVNGFGLPPGYHIGRLAGSWQSLPVYEIGFFPWFATAATLPNVSSQPGAPPTSVTAAQLAAIVQNLTQTQMTALYNLSPCQFLNLVYANASSSVPSGAPILPNIPQLQFLTTNLTPQQLSILTQFLTISQLTSIVTTLTIPQLQYLTQVFTGQQISLLVQILTPQQIATFLTNLTTTQLQTLIQLPINVIVNLPNLSTASLKTLLNITPLGSAIQIAQLVPPLTPLQFATLLTNLSTSQLQQLAQFPAPAILNLINQPLNVLLGLLQLVPLPPAPIVGNQQWLPGIPVVVGAPSSAPASLQGYAQIVATTTGAVYAYTQQNRSWVQVGGSGTGTANNTLSTDTGTTANAYTDVRTLSSSLGVHGSWSLKNTGATFGLQYRFITVDMYGNTTTGADTTLSPGSIGAFGFDTPGSVGNPPFTSVKLQVRDAAAGSHTTFTANASSVG